MLESEELRSVMQVLNAYRTGPIHAPDTRAQGGFPDQQHFP